MKIALFHELHQGGARRMVNEVSKRFVSLGHEVDLYIVDKKKDTHEIENFSHAFFYKFAARKWSGGDWKSRIYEDSFELLKLYFLHRKIASTINNKKYDLVFVHPSQFTQAPFILRFLTEKKIYYCPEVLRMIYDNALNDSKRKDNVLKKIYESINRKVRKEIDASNIRNSTMVLSNSIFTSKNIYEAYHLRSIVVYPAVDTLFFKPAGRKTTIDVLYIGAKDEIDNYVLLQSAVKLIKSKIIIKYHFTNEKWISDEELLRLYQDSKIVVCLQKNEPFGLIPLEAAAAGAVTIALDGGGYAETVQNGISGFLINATAEELAKKIKVLLSDEKLRKKMSDNARNIVLAKWHWERTVDNLEAIFKKSLK